MSSETAFITQEYILSNKVDAYISNIKQDKDLSSDEKLEIIYKLLKFSEGTKTSSEKDDICIFINAYNGCEFNGELYNYEDVLINRNDNLTVNSDTWTEKEKIIKWKGQKSGRDDNRIYNRKQIHIMIKTHKNGNYYYYGISSNNFKRTKEGNPKLKIPSEYEFKLDTFFGKELDNCKTHKNAISKIDNGNYIKISSNVTSIEFIRKKEFFN